MAQSQQPAVNVIIRPFKRLNVAVWPVLGSEVCFRISPTSPLHDIFDFYASTRDIPLALLRCRSLSDGELVRGDQTPADLGIEAGGQLDLVSYLVRSPPPGRLPQDTLQELLEFLKVDEVHAAKRTSYCWQGPGRSAIAHGPLKPVKFVAEHGKRIMYGGVLPASAPPLFRAAWAVDPNETLRILFTWGSDPPLAARFLSIVEPSIDGLERIVRLCEPAHCFFYAKTQLHRWRYGARYNWPHDCLDETVEVIMGWAELIGTPFDVPILDLLPVGRRDLVVSYVSRALQSWTDAAVAADFVSAFFRRAFFDDDDLWLQESDWGEGVPDLGVFTQGWDDSKASALVAAHAADVALYELSRRFRFPEESGPLFTEALNRVDPLLQFKQRVRGMTTEEKEEKYLSLVECASRWPGGFY